MAMYILAASKTSTQTLAVTEKEPAGTKQRTAVYLRTQLCGPVGSIVTKGPPPSTVLHLDRQAFKEGSPFVSVSLVVCIGRLNLFSIGKCYVGLPARYIRPLALLVLSHVPT